jgi:CYTH domain-containing protein
VPVDEIERKFLVRGKLPECEWPVPFTDSVITQTYLVCQASGVTERVRKRLYVDEGRTEYTHNLKSFVGPGHFLETEREVTSDKYQDLLERADPKCKQLTKVRKVFEWEGWTWELDEFVVPNEVTVMEVELPSLDAEITMPPFIEIEKEVTGDDAWSNKSLAAPGWSRP